MTLRKAGLAAALGVMLFVVVFFAGRCYQGAIDEDASVAAQTRADHRVDSVITVKDSSIAEANGRRRDETIRRGLAEQERDQLLENATGHARKDRDRDTTLKKAKSAADSLPIVVEQRDQARQAVIALERADSSSKVVIASLRRDSVEAARIAGETREKTDAQLDGARSELAAMAIKLERASLKGHFLGIRFLPAIECVAGYGGQVSNVRLQPKLGADLSHGAQATCGLKLSLHL